MNAQPTHRVLFLILALVGLAADQAGKYAAFAWLKDHPEHKQTVFQGMFEFVAARTADRETGESVPYVNHGALFGLFQNKEALANACFAIISLAAAIAILFWVRSRTTASDRGLCIALGLIMGGTLGNLYDRLLFGGVRDFLHFFWYSSAQERVVFDWPVFNLADCCLVLGAGLLLLQAFRKQPKAQPTANVSAKQPAEAPVA